MLLWQHVQRDADRAVVNIGGGAAMSEEAVRQELEVVRDPLSSWLDGQVRNDFISLCSV